MTTAVRVFASSYACPIGTNTCHACRACGPTHWAVRPLSACSAECAGSFTDYPTLAAAMAAHPAIDWWALPVVFGEEPEPELVAAVEAHTAAHPPGPP